MSPLPGNCYCLYNVAGTWSSASVTVFYVCVWWTHHKSLASHQEKASLLILMCRFAQDSWKRGKAKRRAGSGSRVGHSPVPLASLGHASCHGEVLLSSHVFTLGSHSESANSASQGGKLNTFKPPVTSTHFFSLMNLQSFKNLFIFSWFSPF